MTLLTNLSFETATGSIDYPFTNDYMFRAILQKDKQVLKALIAALLHLKKESIHDVAITNPIELGAAISDKDFILDIRVNLNNEQLIDLEMQMSNEYNWSERSISYAARSFDQLNSGEEYKEVLPVHSIGFLNFTLFEDQPEFFATYELRNKKTGHLYSSKFSIHVLDLTRIDLATAEDQNYEIDRWAKLFKAKTWEELQIYCRLPMIFTLSMLMKSSGSRREHVQMRSFGSEIKMLKLNSWKIRLLNRIIQSLKIKNCWLKRMQNYFVFRKNSQN